MKNLRRAGMFLPRTMNSIKGRIMINLKLIAVMLTALSAVLSCGENPGSIVLKDWEIIDRQDESIENIIKSGGWQKITMPYSCLIPYPPSMDFQFIWLRSVIKITDDPAKYYGISAGRIKYSESIYINGRLVGQMPPGKINWLPLPRNYVLPSGLLSKGDNHIYIRLGIYGRYNGGILGDVMIQPEDEFERTQFFSSLIYKQMPFGIVILFSCFSLIMLISFLLDRKEKITLFSIPPLILTIIYIFLPLTSYRLISFETYCALKFSLIPAFSIIFILLFQTLYRVYLTACNWFVIPLLTISILIIFYFKDTPDNISINMIISFISLLIIIPYSVYMIYRLNSINRDRFLLITTSLVGFMVLSIMIFEIYSGYTGSQYAELSEIYIPPAFLILGMVVSSREIVKRKKELEHIYDKLGRLEESKISITDTIEQKLKRLIDFINENYRSDLSREGMAATIGIHPNYLGRMFRIYTGRRIHEYINYMRIMDAIKQLEKGNGKITEIAHLVGFESLATFNRVFKKTMGKKPSAYKIKNTVDTG